MMPDNPSAIRHAINQGLQQMLRGNGFPRITAADPELREYLSALRDQIDEFLTPAGA